MRLTEMHEGNRRRGRKDRGSGDSLSTDYVFAGVGEAAYVETDPTGPLSVYGASKLAGKALWPQSGCVHFIFRTSWCTGNREEFFADNIKAGTGTRTY